MTAGLVLEGGGMRGVYTAGVLEYFLEQSLFFPYIIGVSAGACNAASYISRQRGRNKQATIGCIGDPRYLSYRNLWKERSLFGMDFIFDEIPNRLIPFDYAAFHGAPERFVVGTTDAVTGEPVYYEKTEADFLPVIRASSSLPFVSKPVEIKGKLLFDGGISDPIPLQKAIRDGFGRNVVVLTKPEGYRKTPFKWKRFAHMVYPGYPGLVEALQRRSRSYNDTLDKLLELEQEGSVIVLRPSADLKVGRIEKNPVRLTALYELGYEDARKAFRPLEAWLNSH